METNAQAYWMDYAAEQGWTVKQLREAIKAANRAAPASTGPSLFDKKLRPKVTPIHNKWFIQALHGDDKARRKLEDHLDAMDLWVRRVRESLE